MNHILGYEHFENGFVEVYVPVDDIMRIDGEPVQTGPRAWKGWFIADKQVAPGTFVEIHDFIIKRESGVSISGAAYIQKSVKDGNKFRHDFEGSGELREIKNNA